MSFKPRNEREPTIEATHQRIASASVIPGNSPAPTFRRKEAGTAFLPSWESLAKADFSGVIRTGTSAYMRHRRDLAVRSQVYVSSAACPFDEFFTDSMGVVCYEEELPFLSLPPVCFAEISPHYAL
jgi:hypothetical protein